MSNLIKSAREIFIESLGVTLSIAEGYDEEAFIETAPTFNVDAYREAISMARQRGYEMIPASECHAEELDNGGLRIYLYDAQIECESSEAA